MQKQALAKAIAAAAGWGLANASLWDAYNSPTHLPLQGMLDKNQDPSAKGLRLLNFGTNMAIGAGARQLNFLGNPKLAITALLGSPIKDLAATSINAVRKFPGQMDRLAAGATTPSSTKVDMNMSGGTKALLAALVAATVGGAGYLGYKGSQALDASQRKNEGGRIRLKLPTRDQYDQETELEVPVERMNISDAMMGKLRRDLRRKLISETRERTKTKDKGLKAIDKLDDRSLLGADDFEDPLAGDVTYKAASHVQDVQAWISLLDTRAGGAA